MDATRFDRVAILCKRWADRSLKALRAHLVDGMSPSEVAVTFKMLPQNVIELRKRFLAREEKAAAAQAAVAAAESLADFMQRVQPIATQLEPYDQAMHALRDKGYTTEQIATYLHQRGIDVTPSDLNEYMGKSRA